MRREQHFGFNDYSVTTGQVTADQSAGLAARAGASVVRLTFDWRWAEPVRDDYRLAKYDAMYRSYISAGIRPVFMLLYAPSWARDASVQCNRDCRYPPAREHYGQWREMAALLAQRYPLAAGFEIWNEPNLHWYWRPRPDVVRYTELQREAYQAIKAVDPSMPVVSGGLNNKPDTTSLDYSMKDFAEGIYREGGKASMDALTIHPYSVGDSTRFFLESFATARSVRDAAGDSRKPLWVTEFGVTTTGTNPAYTLSEAQQAAALTTQYRLIRGMSDVGLAAVHTMIEPPGTAGVFDQTDPTVGYGLVDGNLVPKPAFCAIAVERGGSGC